MTKGAPTKRVVYGFWKAWKEREAWNLPMWSYSTGNEVGICWLLLVAVWLHIDRAIQRVVHELSHQRGEPHHSLTDHHGATEGPGPSSVSLTSYSCIMQPSGYNSWLHAKATRDEALAFASGGGFTL